MNFEKKPIFITGTDTSVGKTLVTSLLIRSLMAAKADAVAVKPVASGTIATPDGARNADALALQMAMGETAPAYETVNPFCFEQPIAPHLAAQHDGKSIELEALIGHYRTLAARYRHILIEGVGGWSVPLSAVYMQADYVRQLQADVVLVVGVRLGCINHALLSAHAINHDGSRLLGWIANRIDPDLPHADEAVSAIAARVAAPLLGQVPFVRDGASASSAADEITRQLLDRV